MKEFGERRIVTACQAVGAATVEAALQSGDKVVVWGVGAQPEVVAVLEQCVRLLGILKGWLGSNGYVQVLLFHCGRAALSADRYYPHR